MDEHLELIQRAVEARRKFLDAVAHSAAELRHMLEWAELAGELRGISEDAGRAVITEAIRDQVEQAGGRSE